jgi:hypothetical protein
VDGSVVGDGDVEVLTGDGRPSAFADFSVPTEADTTGDDVVSDGLGVGDSVVGVGLGVGDSVVGVGVGDSVVGDGVGDGDSAVRASVSSASAASWIAVARLALISPSRCC